MGYMYILECADGTYYTGSTKNLERRLWEHNNFLGANYTRKKHPVKLVYFEEYQRIDEAFYREKQVQGWSHAKKKALIEANKDRLVELSRNYTQYPRGNSVTSTGSVSEMERTEILNYLSKSVSPSRLNHCLGVEKMALELAERFGVEPELVSPAALLHDLCREYQRDLLLKLAVNFGIVIDDIERLEPLLLHGFVAASLAKSELGIEHPDILEAISYHITGIPQATALTRLIFISDFIEPGRAYEAAGNLRTEAFRIAPEQLLLKVYNYTITFVVNKGYLIHPRSIDGRNELVMKGVKEN
jgi:predicted HD superfamily hydrolase involved in NAD metabolism